MGKERHDIGRDDGKQSAVGYSVRAIRTQEFLYSKNYESQSWPAGNPEQGYKNSDDGPTEEYLVSVYKDTSYTEYEYYELSFFFRPSEELFDVINDSDCINNLADDPVCQKTKDQLSEKMIAELIRQKDPRVLGNGYVFDSYYYMGFEAMNKMYGEQFKIPPHLKKYAATLRENGIGINYFGTDDPVIFKQLFDSGIEFPLVNDIITAMKHASDLGIVPVKPLN